MEVEWDMRRFMQTKMHVRTTGGTPWPPPGHVTVPRPALSLIRRSVGERVNSVGGNTGEGSNGKGSNGDGSNGGGSNRIVSTSAVSTSVVSTGAVSIGPVTDLGGNGNGNGSNGIVVRVP